MARGAVRFYQIIEQIALAFLLVNEARAQPSSNSGFNPRQLGGVLSRLSKSLRFV
ncbi:MAG: hypothetical protein AAF572_29170 [Cyanobacteria bacterium P01_B01_bin.77]